MLEHIIPLIQQSNLTTPEQVQFIASLKLLDHTKLLWLKDLFSGDKKMIEALYVNFAAKRNAFLSGDTGVLRIILDEEKRSLA